MKNKFNSYPSIIIEQKLIITPTVSTIQAMACIWIIVFTFYNYFQVGELKSDLLLIRQSIDQKFRYLGLNYLSDFEYIP